MSDAGDGLPRTPRLAIVGGMGPLASAEFVKTIYERTTVAHEQAAPSLLLWSDPSLPDRTTALRDGRTDVLTAALEDTINRCCELGAEEIVVCCITMHAALDGLPPQLRRRVVSLVDVLLRAIVDARTPTLLLATTGTRLARVFERHERWPEACEWLQWPGDADQERVHRAIYDVKRNRVRDAVALVQWLLGKYQVRAFAAGCTELHLVAKAWPSAPAPCVDPLEIIATRAADRAVAPDASSILQS